MAKRERIPLTQERLRELLHYDPETGVFTWMATRAGAFAGAKAGSISIKGAVVIRIDYQLYYAHRLAWFYMNGGWPDFGVDHQDLDPTNNRWNNLRRANQSQNAANTKKRRTMAGKPCTSRYKGVTLQRSSGRWMAQITHGRGFHQYLGTFDTEVEAHEAYIIAAKQAHGDFIRAD
jgi:hypothetical protein